MHKLITWTYISHELLQCILNPSFINVALKYFVAINAFLQFGRVFFNLNCLIVKLSYDKINLRWIFLLNSTLIPYEYVMLRKRSLGLFVRRYRFVDKDVFLIKVFRIISAWKDFDSLSIFLLEWPKQPIFTV